MTTCKRATIVIIFLLCAQTSCKKQNPSEPQVELIAIAGVTYAQYVGVWFTVANGKQGDRVDLAKLIVKPKPSVDMTNFDYQSAGVPKLAILTIVASEYYILDTSQLADPFDTARKLWDTSKFESLYFDVYLSVHTT